MNSWRWRPFAKPLSVGYPLLLESVQRRGGKGMRAVHDPAEFDGAAAGARREAVAAFGDGRIYIERLLSWSKHVEIQVLADQHGRTVHLGERECSVQRRHQKVFEEAPGPTMTEALREAMGKAAVAAAEAVNYVGAGTVEFLLAPTGEFFFLEMNTRIQVEHPVTELVTGVDIVREQLRIAKGEPMSCGPLMIRGHAIEVRLYAEDAANGFLLHRTAGGVPPLKGRAFGWTRVSGRGTMSRRITTRCWPNSSFGHLTSRGPRKDASGAG